MRITFEIPYAPVAKQRAKKFFNKTNNKMTSWTPNETVVFENAVKICAVRHRPEILLKEPLSLSCDFYLSKPKKPKFTRPCVRPDLDNYLKSIMDGLNEIIWKDDGCVCRIESNKFYTEDYPKVLVTIETINE